MTSIRRLVRASFSGAAVRGHFMPLVYQIPSAFVLICLLLVSVALYLGFSTFAASKTRSLPTEFSTRVVTSKGVVRGFHVDYGSNRDELFFGSADIFLGIPFAQPPLGQLRFQLPEQMCKYDDEVGEFDYKPRCSQVNLPGKTSSEDCLYLNVFTPNVTGKYPVMIWIHGGAFMNRGSHDFHYKGAVRNFVSNDVVVVTIQYRLGPLGFFTTFTPEFPANVGLFDQILALRWVKEEIAAFGGDPEQITLFGQSAGAMSVSLLSLSPLTRGLYHRVILNSGSPLVSLYAPNDMRESMQRERAAQWCNVTADPMASRSARQQLKKCLAGNTAEELTKYDTTANLPDALKWTPMMDGVLFPEDPEILTRSRPPYDALLIDMPVEQALFPPEYSSGDVSSYGPHSLKQALLDRHYGYLSDDQLDKMVEILINNFKTHEIADDDHLGWFKLVMDIISAERYTYRGRVEAEWLKKQGSRTFLATFTYDRRICGPHSAIPGYDPTTHFTDVCYLWFTPAEWEKAASQGKVTARDLAVAENFARVYTQFAKNGTTGWAESGIEYRYMKFDDRMEEMGKEWRTKEKYVLPPVIGDYPPIKLSSIMGSVLKANGAVVLEEWQRIVSSCKSTD